MSMLAYNMYARSLISKGPLASFILNLPLFIFYESKWILFLMKMIVHLGDCKSKILSSIDTSI